jgi:hypothetical protein
MAGDQDDGKGNVVEIHREHYRLVFYSLFYPKINPLTLTFSNMQRH